MMELREKVARLIDGPNWRVRDCGGISYSGAVKHRTDKSLETADAILAIPEIAEALDSGGPGAAIIAMPPGFSATFEDGIWYVRSDAD